MSLSELELKNKCQKQLRTIAKLKKELKHVSKETQKITDDNSNVAKFLGNTHILLSEADVQEADMKGQIEEIKRASADIKVEDMKAQITNLKAIDEAEEYLQSLETHYNDLDEKNQSQKDQIATINAELTEVFDQIQSLDEQQRTQAEEREQKEKELETAQQLPEIAKNLKVRISLFEQEEKYIGEELERVSVQNKLMERDKKELTYHKEQLVSQKKIVDLQNQGCMQALEYSLPEDLGEVNVKRIRADAPMQYHEQSSSIGRPLYHPNDSHFKPYH